MMRSNYFDWNFHLVRFYTFTKIYFYQVKTSDFYLISSKAFFVKKVHGCDNGSMVAWTKMNPPKVVGDDISVALCTTDATPWTFLVAEIVEKGLFNFLTFVTSHCFLAHHKRGWLLELSCRKRSSRVFSMKKGTWCCCYIHFAAQGERRETDKE